MNDADSTTDTTMDDLGFRAGRGLHMIGTTSPDVTTIRSRVARKRASRVATAGLALAIGTGVVITRDQHRGTKIVIPATAPSTNTRPTSTSTALIAGAAPIGLISADTTGVRVYRDHQLNISEQPFDIAYRFADGTIVAQASDKTPVLLAAPPRRPQQLGPITALNGLKIIGYGTQRGNDVLALLPTSVGPSGNSNVSLYSIQTATLQRLGLVSSQGSWIDHLSVRDDLFIASMTYEDGGPIHHFVRFAKANEAANFDPIHFGVGSDATYGVLSPDAKTVAYITPKGVHLADTTGNDIAAFDIVRTWDNAVLDFDGRWIVVSGAPEPFALDTQSAHPKPLSLEYVQGHVVMIDHFTR